MEVHHHSHHPKKWKEYLTEFVMLFLAVSMGFIAENIREKHIENERSEELMKAFVMDVKENQKQLDSLIIKNNIMVRFYDSLVFNHGYNKESANLIKLADSVDLRTYRFLNKKTIFEQMKNTGALRYIQDKELLTAMLRYEENANYVEIRSMSSETDQYNNEFRPTLNNSLPLAFFLYMNDEQLDQLKNSDKMDSLVNPGLYKNYVLFKNSIKKELEETELSNEQLKKIAKAWYFRKERISFGLRYQIILRNQGEELLTLIENKKH